MRNNRIIITCELEKNFRLCEPLRERGLSTNVVEDDGKLLLEEINCLNPGAVLLPSFMPLQDAVGVISLARRMKTGVDDTLYFVMGNGEGIKTINYIMNNGADYYFHVSAQTNAIVDKIMTFFEDTEYEPLPHYALPRGRADGGSAVREALRSVGILPHLKGFSYLNDAVVMGLKSVKGPMPLTKQVYPVIARKYDTTELRVERAMRNAIMVAWSNFEKNSYKGDNFIFSKCAERPSNREFLGLVTFELKRAMPDSETSNGLTAG